MADDAYKRLIGALNARGTNLPAVECAEFYALVEYLFTRDEADIASKMPMGHATIEQISENIPTKDLEKLSKQLETMGDKGLIHIMQKDNRKTYEALPFVPGIIEFQLMRGIVDDRHRKIALLLREYSKAIKNLFMSEAPPQIDRSAPSSRKVAVDKLIPHLITAIPYAEVKELIKDTEYIAAGTCVCRHQGNLLGKPCSKPIKNCMAFGVSAKFAADHGFAELISKEEAIKRINEAEKEGLIHSYADSPDNYINILCNCCQCHCMNVKNVKRSPIPSQAVNARYLIQIKDDDCIACEACIERCQMEALKMLDGRLIRDAVRCIGCGICMYVCPTDALVLEKREAGKIALKKC